MINWRLGLQRGPTGDRMREIPVRAVWSSSLWCSKDGTVYRRYYNPIKAQWHWSEKRQEYSINADGKLGLYILDQWIPLTTCIALAWMHRLPGSPTRTKLVDPNLPPHADNIQWVEMGTSEEAQEMKDEVWKPLRWRIGIINCPTSYQISSRGRLKSPQGDVTSGFYFNDSMYACCRGCGLVDLLAAAQIKPNTPHLRPYIKMAVDAILTGHTPKDLSRDAGVELSTAHSYFTQAAPFLSAPDLQRLGPNLVSRDLWAVLHQLQADKDIRLGGSLKELLPVIEEMLPADSEFKKNEYKLSELRFARLCIESTCSSLNICGRL